MRYRVVHVTTVHARDDTRIRLKEVASLARVWPGEVAVFVQDGKGDQDDSGGGVVIRDTGDRARSRLRRMTIGAFAMYRAVRRARPYLVHFHDPEFIPWAVLLRLSGIKVIYDVHEDLPRQMLSKHWIPQSLRGVLARLTEALEVLAAKVFDGIVAATPTIAHRFSEKKTVTVQNFPLLHEFALIVAKPAGDRRPAFAYVGGITGIRGSLEMVRAVGVLAKRGIECHLELAGSFSPVSHEAQLRDEAGWQRVHFRGFLDRRGVASLLTSVCGGLVLLHPTANYMDALPVKLFEYMAAGLPVIASDFPLWREIVHGAGCGLLVNPLDPGAIADAMQWILEHPQEAANMGQRGRAAIEALYNWESESQKLIALYRRVMPNLSQRTAA